MLCYFSIRINKILVSFKNMLWVLDLSLAAYMHKYTYMRVTVFGTKALCSQQIEDWDLSRS